jgi:hypothetical protein
MGIITSLRRNVLHLNNGATIPLATFPDLAGVEASDWSWGELCFSIWTTMDFKDLFIANGIYQDSHRPGLPAVHLPMNPSLRSVMSLIEGVDYKELIDIIPSNKVANHAYKNEWKATIL